MTETDTKKNNTIRADRYAYAILTLGTFFFASNHIIGRGVHEEIPPVGLSFWRWAAGIMMLLPFFWRDTLASAATIKTHLRPLAFLGVTMIGSTTLVLLALNYTSAINTSLVNATQPVITVMLAWAVFREHLGWSKIVGMLAGLAGVVVMVSRANWQLIASLQFNGGDLIALLAMVGFALYAINIRRIPADLKPGVSLLVIIVTGCLGLLPFYIAETLLYRSVPFTLHAVVIIVTLSLLISVFGMFIWNEGNRIIGPSRAGMFVNLIPVFTTIMAISFLGEHLYFYHVAGALLISTGIFLVLRK